MKIWMLAALGILVGLGLGVGMTISRIGAIRDDDELVVPTKVPFGVEARAPELPPQDGPQPKFVLENATYDFGALEIGETGEHAFVIRNEGEYPLVLTRGETTCKCTMSKLGAGEDGKERAEVPPGGQIDVTLSWEIKPNSESNFRQTAVIFSNDRDKWRVVLTITGRVESSVIVLPDAVAFNDLLPGEDTEATFHVATRRRDDLQIVNHRWLDEKLAPYFEVTFVPMPRGQVPALDAYNSALTGVVKVKHGLPPGPINQALEFETNVPNVPSSKLLVTGSISGHMSAMGKRYRTVNAQRGLLDLGIIGRGQAVSHELKLWFRGPRRGEARPQVVETRPQALRATLGDPITRDSVVEYPLRIEVDANSPPMRYTGGQETSGLYAVERYAEIMIDGGGEDYGRLQILVVVAVGDR